MSRINVSSREAAPTASQPLLDRVFKTLGVVADLFCVFARSPAAPEGFLDLSGALSKTLEVKTRERIAIAVAAVDGQRRRTAHRLP